MMILQTGKRRSDRWTSAGFTLIELVLVMAILVVVLSMTATSLTSFFKGRALDAEGRRFVSLTRHAQNRAISEGVPMTVWIDEEERKYGLEIAAGYAVQDDKAAEFQLGKDLEIELLERPATAIVQIGNENLLRFNPDGFMDENNPQVIAIKEKDGETVFVAPSRNRLNYEITTNEVYRARR
jgi:type II secretion system protein H